MIKVFENISKEQIAEVVDEVAVALSPGCLVFLEGDPGAGKTFLISQLLWRFDISEVASPTFALHHRYQAQGHLFHHFDLYRVESEDELETVGLWDIMEEDRDAYFLIEWASKLPVDIWPMQTIQIKIEITDRLTEPQHKLSQDSRNYKVTVQD